MDTYLFGRHIDIALPFAADPAFLSAQQRQVNPISQSKALVKIDGATGSAAIAGAIGDTQSDRCPRAMATPNQRASGTYRGQE
jgi:hypothetical protein